MKKLHTVFATKQEMNYGFQEVKSDIKDLREMFQQMMVSMDGVTKVLGDMRMELAAVIANLNRHDRWIRQIANKTQTKLIIE